MGHAIAIGDFGDNTAAGMLGDEHELAVRSACRATRISQTELDAIRRKVAAHWNPVMSALSEPDQYVVVVRFHLERDGRLSAAPQVVSKGSAPHYQAAVEAAKRAVVLSQPFDMLSPSNNESWQEVEVNFSPSVMCSRAAIAWIETHPEIARAHPEMARQCDAARSLATERNPQ